MESGIEPVADLVEYLNARGRPAWARWAIERAADGWRLRHVEIIIGAKPAGYAKRRWLYAEHEFVEQPATTRQIAAALRGKAVRIGRRSVKSAPMQTTANRSRLQSYADYGGHRLSWPVTRYEISKQDASNANGGHDPLISLNSPSFAQYDSAFAAFFRPNGPPRWQHNFGVVVVDVDTDARIDRLSIRPGQILVDVAGDDLSGCAIQVSSGGASHTVALDGPGQIVLPMPEPFVREVMITLADERWRDLRVVNPPGVPNAVDPSIVWDDPQLELAALLAGGEGIGVEFKSKLPTKATDSIRTALKAVPAFANGGGGVLIFGVDDDGQVLGIEGDPVEATKRLTDLIHDNVHPVASPRIETHDVGGKAVLVVNVDSGASRPYAMFRNPPLFFARHGATTFPATREEIVQFAIWSQVQGGFPH